MALVLIPIYFIEIGIGFGGDRVFPFSIFFGI
jgi:hypothetical protein